MRSPKKGGLTVNISPENLGVSHFVTKREWCKEYGRRPNFCCQKNAGGAIGKIKNGGRGPGAADCLKLSLGTGGNGRSLGAYAKKKKTVRGRPRKP